MKTDKIILSTQFAGIPDTDLDGRIKAMKADIRTRAQELEAQTRDTITLTRATLDWYDENMVDHIANTARIGMPPSRILIETQIRQQVPPTEINPKAHTHADYALRLKPATSLVTWARGENDAIKTQFLETLKAEGETTLAMVQDDLDDEQLKLNRAQDKNWGRLKDIHKTYTTFLQAVKDQDDVALTRLMKSELVQHTHKKRWDDLLNFSVYDYASGHEALKTILKGPTAAQHGFKTPSPDLSAALPTTTPTQNQTDEGQALGAAIGFALLSQWTEAAEPAQTSGGGGNDHEVSSSPDTACGGDMITASIESDPAFRRRGARFG